MSVSSSSSSYNIFNSMGIKTNGVGGLSSGLNTDELVKSMTSSTRNRIALQQQKKQTLNWKLTAYRSVTKLLANFQQKYFSYSKTGSSNIMSAEFFNTYKATSSSSKVSVSGGTSTVDFQIASVDRLATAQYLTQSKPLSKELIGTEDLAAAVAENPDYFTGKTLRLEVDGSTQTISLDSLKGLDMTAGSGANGVSSRFEEQLQYLVDDAFGKKMDGGSNVNVALEGGKLKLSSESSTISVAANSPAFGLNVGETNRANLDTKLKDIAGIKENLVGDVFKFTINGAEITVKADDTLSTLRSRINASTGNVTMTYDNNRDEFRLTSKLPGGGDFLKIEDTQGNLMNQIFGAKSGGGLTSTQMLSSNPSLLAAEGTLNLASAKEIGDMSFNLTINGSTKKITVSKDDMASVINQSGLVHTLNEKIKGAFGEDSGVAFKVDGGKLSLTNEKGAAVTIANTSFKAADNFLGKLGFEQNSYTNIVNTTPTLAGMITSNKVSNPSGLDFEKAFELTINGRTETVKLSDEVITNLEALGNKLTHKDVAEALNNAITDAFDGFAVGFGYSTKDQTFTLSAADGVIFEMKDTEGILSELGFGSKLSGVDKTYTNLQSDPLADVTLADIGITDGQITINGETYDLNSTDSIRDFMNQINQESGGELTASIVEGRLSITSKSGELDIKNGAYDPDTGDLIDGTETNALQKLFGADSYTTESGGYGDRMVRGQNSEITLADGTKISRAGNNFELYGLNITLNEVSARDENGKLLDSPIAIKSASNPDEVVDKIKAFIEDYNTLIEAINTMIYEEKSKDYSALSDEQKGQMSASEIDKWESEAQKGLLRYDSTLMGIVQQFRSAVYQTVDAVGIAGFNIGITTKSTTAGGYSQMDNGKLEITEDGEAMLREALTNNPDMVREFFTNKDDGLSVRFNNIINGAIESSSDPTKRGSLVRLAGTELLTGDNTSTLGNQISIIDTMLSTLKTRLETEYNRYWAQFSRLETALGNMNTQSSWLTDFGS